VRTRTSECLLGLLQGRSQFVKKIKKKIKGRNAKKRSKIDKNKKKIKGLDVKKKSKYRSAIFTFQSRDVGE